MDLGSTILFLVSVLIGIGLFAGVCYMIFKSPFEYPYCHTELDISGLRTPTMRDLIDVYLNKHGFSKFSDHYKQVEIWKTECKKQIDASIFKNLRAQQFESILDDEHMFRFELTRRQTRYSQSNYVRSSYLVQVTVAEHAYSYTLLKQRFDALAKIGFECTLSEYHSKEQRKRMTKALREKIAIRDNYTCQNCGKYMPDGVGLQIDHIVPIAKGGKSVPSNLQVLCSKCNGKKSNK